MDLENLNDDKAFYENSSSCSPNKLVVHEDLDKIFVGCVDGNIAVLSLDDGSVVKVVKLHHDVITSVTLDDMGKKPLVNK